MSQKKVTLTVFVKNEGSNHLFDRKMNKWFAKLAKLSDNFVICRK